MTKGQKMPEELKQRMIKTLIKVFASKSKPIVQYDKKGNIITAWKSLMALERIVGKRRSHVADCCKGKRKSAYGFIWKYETN
jgi:hypothetical protein